MCKFISCGRCDKKFIFLFLGNYLVFFFLFSALDDSGIVPNKDLPKIKNILLYLLLFYIGQSLFVFPEIIINKCIFKKKDQNKTIRNKKSRLSIKYIYNNLIELSQKDKFIIFIMSFVIFIVDVLKVIIIKLFQKSEILISCDIYNTFLLIFLLLFSKSFFKIKYYKHQNISIFIFIITLLIIILFNITFNLKEIYIFLYQICSSFFDAIVGIFIKYLIHYKYFSHFKAAYVFGFINSILLIIVYVIVSFIPCDLSLCDIKYNEKFYIDNILYIYNNLNLKTTVLYIITSIFFGFVSIIYNYVIDYYTVCCFFLVINNRDEILYNIPQNNVNIFLECISYFICLLQLFAILVFQEWIELHFCELDKNIKKNIQDRSDDDLNLNVMDSEELIENQLEEDDNEGINDIKYNENDEEEVNDDN